MLGHSVILRAYPKTWLARVDRGVPGNGPGFRISPKYYIIVSNIILKELAAHMPENKENIHDNTTNHPVG